MKVKILNVTQNPIDIIWTCARTCYSMKSPIELWEDVCTVDTVKKRQFVDNVLKSGHTSLLENINVTIAIEGVSRSLTHQLVRHRHAVYAQKSQRYVEIKEDQDHLEKLFNRSVEDYSKPDGLYSVLNKYFVDGDKLKNANGYYYALDSYLQAIKNGDTKDEARRFLPNNIKTDLTMTVNMRELVHISNLRLCARASKEIQNLFKLIKKELTQKDEFLGGLLKPSCEQLGFCPEGDKCCGRKKPLEDK